MVPGAGIEPALAFAKRILSFPGLESNYAGNLRLWWVSGRFSRAINVSDFEKYAFLTA
jgi:hypothetical protein